MNTIKFLLALLFGHYSRIANVSPFGTLYTLSVYWRGQEWVVWQKAEVGK